MNSSELNKLKEIHAEYYYIQDINPNSENYKRYWKARYQGYAANKEDAYKYTRKEAKEICLAARLFVIMVEA